MKRFAYASVAVAVALFASSMAFAATPTTEPSLPADIGTYQPMGRSTCDKKYPEKALSMEGYMRTINDSAEVILVVTLNGKKVAQAEMLLSHGSTSSVVSYVRNSPEKNWVMYTNDESENSDERFYAETGLTATQFASCDE